MEAETPKRKADSQVRIFIVTVTIHCYFEFGFYTVWVEPAWIAGASTGVFAMSRRCEVEKIVLTRLSLIEFPFLLRVLTPMIVS